MNRRELVKTILQQQSYLCVGLDTDITRIPRHLLSRPDPVFSFNKEIIDATKDLCVAYKINTAFYESRGIRGWESLERTLSCIPPEKFKIADAKRGDIGNTSQQYAKTFFEVYDFDAVTVAPYMGKDSVAPFLEYKDKWTILLALTSNRGNLDFQLERAADGEYFYQKVLRCSMEWGTPDNLMYVVGATCGEQMENVRNQTPAHFYLVPGIGAQGGNLQEISRCGLNDDVGMLVNASRSVIYAGNGEDFAEDARRVAGEYRQEMQEILNSRY